MNGEGPARRRTWRPRILLWALLLLAPGLVVLFLFLESRLPRFGYEMLPPLPANPRPLDIRGLEVGRQGLDLEVGTLPATRLREPALPRRRAHPVALEEHGDGRRQASAMSASLERAQRACGGGER